MAYVPEHYTCDFGSHDFDDPGTAVAVLQYVSGDDKHSCREHLGDAVWAAISPGDPILMNINRI